MRFEPLAGCLLLTAACGGGSGISVPAQFAGAWGADCTKPFVTFAGSNVHVGPDNADYPLKSATVQGTNLTIKYDIKASPVTETYAMEGDNLRLDRGIYAGQEATWHNGPMHKCT